MLKNITISALAAVLSLPAFAEITNNATCNTTNLGQSNNNSTANVEANWNANTININWYNGDTRILQNTCTYDGSITLPTEPTKPGYTFAGWRLRAAAATPTYTSCEEITNQSDCEAFIYDLDCNGDVTQKNCMWEPDAEYNGTIIPGGCTTDTRCSGGGTAI